MIKELKVGALVMGAGLALAAGCGSAQTAAVPQAPEWVHKASGAFKDGGQSVFYGVGIAGGIKNAAMRRTAADDRGRAEIAKVMNSYVTSLTKSYMASTIAGDPSKSSEEQHVTDTMKNFAKFTLHGSIPVDHWVAPDGTEYALIKLDMKAIQQTLNDAKELDASVRDHIRANAEKAHDELRAEEARR